MTKSRIIKINPADTCNLKHIKTNLMANCPRYGYMNLDTFLECRDNIYILVPYEDGIESVYSYSGITAIVGCRRTNMEKLGVKALEYYSQSNKVIYSIEFLHCQYIDSDKDVSGINQCMIQILLDACLKDKNDSFIVYKPDINTITNDEIIALIKSGFYRDKDDKTIFIRRPITQ